MGPTVTGCRCDGVWLDGVGTGFSSSVRQLHR